MLAISEFLPNPVGRDSLGEAVEISNSGGQKAGLNGFYLQNKSGQKFLLSGEVPAGGYLAIKDPQLKLTLHNQDETLYLYNPADQLVDKLGFVGSAPEGKSVIHSGRSFVFINPTLGYANAVQISQNNGLASLPQIFNHDLSLSSFILLIAGVGLALSCSIIFIIKSNEKISKFFFGAN
jgi:hypothetical protein